MPPPLSSCSCKYCGRADEHFIQESEFAKRSKRAQVSGDYESAKIYDRARVRLLYSMMECLGRCEEIRK